MSEAPRRRCSACGAVTPAGDPHPFRCPNADSGDDRDHHLDDDAEDPIPHRPEPDREAAHPFIRWRRGLWSYAAARAGGLDDADWREIVERLDAAVATVDGRGFRVTPFAPSDSLAARAGLAPGTLWVKDETGNVAGSHKGRHLFGLALALEVLERTGRVSPDESRARELAIASCGNAALAAAVVARAAGRPLRVFVPTDADPRIVDRLHTLEARVEVCPRAPRVPGDPCIHAFHAAVRGGALPFCCQGNENGLAIEGGMTLAWEMIEALETAGATLDRLFVQVGGGALASACVRAWRPVAPDARSPAVHPVQTAGAWPLRRAWEALRERIAPDAGDDPASARTMAGPGRAAARERALREGQLHRSRFMRPWEEVPHSIAHGILDDETYDWLEVLRGTLESGGWPVVVSEERLREANAMAREADYRVDATGSAGLAGLLELRARGAVGRSGTTAVLFTGALRG